MKKLLLFCATLLALPVFGQLPPVVRNALTTNALPYGSIQKISPAGAVTNFYEPNALANASSRSSPGDILMAYGALAINAPVVLTNVILRGAGAVFTSHVGTSVGCAIVPYAGTRCEFFTLQATNPFAVTSTSQLIGCDNSAGQPSITNAVLFGLTINGDNDGIYIKHTNACTATISFITGKSRTDIIAIQAPGEFNYDNSYFSGGTNGGNRMVGIASASTNRFTACTFDISPDSGASASAVAIVTSAGSWVRLKSCLLVNESTNFTPSLLANSTASTFEIDSCRFENKGTNTLVALNQTGSASARARVWNSDVFSANPTLGQFAVSKGQLFSWGGNVDPGFTTTGNQNLFSGITNLWLATTSAAPASAVNPFYITVKIGGTNELRIPAYAP